MNYDQLGIVDLEYSLGGKATVLSKKPHTTVAFSAVTNIYSVLYSTAPARDRCSRVFLAGSG